MLIPSRHPRSPRHSSWKPRPKVSPQYLAAIIDGEGTITTQRQNTGNGGYVAKVQVANTSLALIEALKDSYGGMIYTRKNTPTKTIYHWRVYGQTALPIIRAALPYFLIKKAHALLLLELLETCHPGRGTQPTPLQLLRREEINQTLKGMQSRSGGSVHG